MSFSQLGLTKAQLRACESLGYEYPTPIQTTAIPVILTGQDLIGCAETGTGKTAAFLLPIIQRISERSRPGVRVLVLAPTRELALQIQKNYRELNPIKSNRSVIVMGGANIRSQIADLRHGVTVVIATPGRLLDLTERGAINLSTLEVLVIDEADRMLLYRSTDGGTTWRPRVEHTFADRTYVAVDDTGGPFHGSIYIMGITAIRSLDATLHLHHAGRRP